MFFRPIKFGKFDQYFCNWVSGLGSLWLMFNSWEARSNGSNVTLLPPGVLCCFFFFSSHTGARE